MVRVPEDLTGRQQADKCRAVADLRAALSSGGSAGGVLVHLTAHPEVITARLRSRDGSAAPASGRIRAIIHAYHSAFALLDGTAPVITADISAPDPGCPSNLR
jgi:hypothetical protein